MYHIQINEFLYCFLLDILTTRSYSCGLAQWSPLLDRNTCAWKWSGINNTTFKIISIREVDIVKLDLRWNFNYDGTQTERKESYCIDWQFYFVTSEVIRFVVVCEEIARMSRWMIKWGGKVLHTKHGEEPLSLLFFIAEGWLFYLVGWKENIILRLFSYSEYR